MTTSSQETNASAAELDARAELRAMYETSPLPIDELMANFGLCMRGSVLIKLLVINELYLRIRRIPGTIVESGAGGSEPRAV